jgi:hypothetical protein
MYDFSHECLIRPDSVDINTFHYIYMCCEQVIYRRNEHLSLLDVAK